MSKARTAYFAANEASLDLLDEIRQAIIDRSMEIPCGDDGRPAPHWGHVGDAQDHERKLRDLADQLLRRGEYAA